MWLYQIYEKKCLPHLIDWALRSSPFQGIREKTFQNLSGHVLELGAGSGINFSLYPEAVEQVQAIDPSEEASRLAQKEIQKTSVPIEYRCCSADALPFEDNTFDYVVSSWVLCTVPEPSWVLQEVKRVLKPGGSYVFADHGLARGHDWLNYLQQGLTPIQKTLFGGCHLNRDIVKLFESEGFQLQDVDEFFVGPRNPFLAIVTGRAYPDKVKKP